MKEYEPPFSSAAQPEKELKRVHPRWIKRLTSSAPQGVPVDGAGWPATFGNQTGSGRGRHRLDQGQGFCLQCGDCCYYIPLEGSLGMDWGACSNPESQYDATVVFEHWTCKHFRYIEKKKEEREEREE